MSHLPTLTFTSPTPTADEIVKRATPKLLKQIGPWSFARFCRNNLIPFEVCYRTMFNRQPRI